MRYTIEITLPQSIAEAWDNGLSQVVWDAVGGDALDTERTAIRYATQERLQVVFEAEDNYSARTIGLRLWNSLEEPYKPLSATIRPGHGMFAGPRFDLLED